MLFAYPLSRKDFRYRNFFTFMVFFTMLFNGGLVSQYIMWTQLIVVKNTILAYIIPNLLMSSFNVMIIRNFFSNDIPFEIIEAAKIDGSGEFNTFLKIVLPMSKPIFAAIGIVPNAVLTRDLRVKEKAIVSLTALVVSGTVGVVMAINGFSYWSLATQQVLYNVMICIGRYFFARWAPTLRVTFAPVKRMFVFSYKVLITTVLTTINNNVLTVVFGRLFPAASVGDFTQANKWNTMANQLVSNTVAQVAQPVLTRINEDNERQRRVFGKMLRFTAFMAFPAMFGLALIAPQFILSAIGEQWTNSIPLLQILCISGAFIPLYTVYQNLFLSLGKSDIYMWLSIGQIVMMLVAVLACHSMGITAMVVAFASVTILWLLAWQVFASRLIGYSFTSMLRDLLPFMFIALAVMGITYLVTLPVHNMYLLLVLQVVIAVALYKMTMKLSRARIFEECIEFVRTFRRKSTGDNHLT